MPTEPRRSMKGTPTDAIDPKGENAMLTARHREETFGHRCILLDPFRIVPKGPDVLNPLDFISNSRQVLDDCRDLGEQLQEREADCNQAQAEERHAE